MIDMGSTERKRRSTPHQPTGQWISTKKRLAIYIRDSFSCVYCGTDLRLAAPAEINLDHLVSRSKGGTNDQQNLVTACRSCNCSRGDRDLAEFAPGGALDRIAKVRVQPLNIELAQAILNGDHGRLVAELEGQR